MSASAPASRRRHLPGTDDREAHASRSPVVRRAAAIADSTAFSTGIFAVILANALVLGLETYDGVRAVIGPALTTLNDVFLAVFVVEVAIRLTAHGRRPQRFFRSGWNVFDFAVVAAAFLPGLRENATLLRLARLARIVRVVRLLPDLRVLFAAIGRSLPGVASLAVLTLLLIYLYGMVGWVIFDQSLPDDYGTIGAAMLTMFLLLSLEGLPDFVAAGMQAEGDATVIFFISYVIVAAFLVFNFFIGVVLESLEQARAIEARREAEERAEHGEAPDPEARLTERLQAIRSALDELEADVRAQRTT